MRGARSIYSGDKSKTLEPVYQVASLEATPRRAMGFNKGGIIIIGYYDGERIIDPRFRHLS